MVSGLVSQPLDSHRNAQQHPDCHLECLHNLARRHLRQVLMSEVAAQPAVLGSTVFGYNDAYRRLRPFVLDWRAACAAAGAAQGATAHRSLTRRRPQVPT